jgi:hypothetical protein
VVERLLLPTVSWFEPSWKVPAPSIEPAVIPPVDREDMSNTPTELPMAPAMKRAFPPVALSAKMVIPPGFVIMVALPAVLALRKERFAWSPTIKVGALEELLTMPAPVMLIEVKTDGIVARI